MTTLPFFPSVPLARSFGEFRCQRSHADRRAARTDLLDAALAAGVTGLVLADAILGPVRLTVLDHLLLAAGALALAARSRAPALPARCC